MFILCILEQNLEPLPDAEAPVAVQVEGKIFFFCKIFYVNYLYTCKYCKIISQIINNN